MRYSSPWLLSVRTLPSASASSRPSKAKTPELISRIARCASVASLCSTIAVTAPLALVPHDPAVAGGVGDLGGQHGHGVAVGGVRRGELPQRLAGQQRGVAADDDHGAVEGDPAAAAPPGPSGRRARCRSARACTAVRTSASISARCAVTCSRAWPDDDDQVLGRPARGRRRRTCPTRERPQMLVQDLGGRRLHTGALTRCEDDDGCRAVGAHGCALRLRWWGVDIRRIPGGFRAEMRAGPDRAVRTRESV